MSFLPGTITAWQTETVTVTNRRSPEEKKTVGKIPVVAPAIDYWRTTIDKKKGAEVARLKVARIFNPLHVLGYPISVADIDSLKIFRLSEHLLIRLNVVLKRSSDLAVTVQ